MILFDGAGGFIGKPLHQFRALAFRARRQVGGLRPECEQCRGGLIDMIQHAARLHECIVTEQRGRVRRVGGKNGEGETEADDCGDGRENICSLFHGVRFLLYYRAGQAPSPCIPGGSQAANWKNWNECSVEAAFGFGHAHACGPKTETCRRLDREGERGFAGSNLRAGIGGNGHK
ncbi:hypothetical protein D3C80_1241880 [compost metagenome]